MPDRHSLDRIAQPLGERPALIVVDVILGFTDPECPLGSEADAVVSANATLMDAFHQRRLPVVLTTVVYHNEEQASVFRRRLPPLNVLTPDSRWVRVDPRLPVSDDDYLLEKTHASAFHGTGLDQWLRARNVDSVVVTGLTTSGCVRASAVDGLQYNFPVWVPEEATGDRDLTAHKANLYDLNAKYADVVPLQQVLDSVLG